MKRAEYINALQNNFEVGLNLMVKKNQDYASEDDPFKNFNGSVILGITPEKGIMLQMLDKMSRISNLLDNNNPSVSDEKIQDSIMDLMNYSNILLTCVNEKVNKSYPQDEVLTK